jgi:hypothetical protein
MARLSGYLDLRAKELALDQYRRLFEDKFLLNPVDGKYYPFPALSVQEFTQSEAQGDVWIVRAAPPLESRWRRESTRRAAGQSCVR